MATVRMDATRQILPIRVLLRIGSKQAGEMKNVKQGHYVVFVLLDLVPGTENILIIRNFTGLGEFVLMENFPDYSRDQTNLI